MSQITTCTFFKLETFSNKLWALSQMQLGHVHFKNSEGLVFYKLLGSGAENGFSSKPNFGTYALLCIWDSEINATNFFEKIRFLTSINPKVLNHSPFMHMLQKHTENGTESNHLFPRPL
jgi:hypothetical protein